jgi:type II secretory ATPase GspE/PulE/Tfp pilus assembly ATPase PilB-like protein
MGMDPFNFAVALLGILAQRLAKRLCSKCKQPYGGRNEMKQSSGILLGAPQYRTVQEDAKSATSMSIGTWRSYASDKRAVHLWGQRGARRADSG